MMQFHGFEVEQGRQVLCAKGQIQGLSRETAQARDYWGGRFKRVNNSVMVIPLIINAKGLTLGSLKPHAHRPYCQSWRICYRKPNEFLMSSSFFFSL